MTIRRKLILLITTAVIGIVTVGGLGLQGIITGQSGIENIGRNSLPSVSNTLIMEGVLTVLSRNNYQILGINPDAALDNRKIVLAGIIKDKKAAQQRFEQAAKDYGPLALSDFEKEHWKTAKALVDQWLAADAMVIANAEKVLANPSDEAFFTLNEEMRKGTATRDKIFDDLNEKLILLANWNQSDADNTFKVAKDSANTAWMTSVAIFLVAMVVLIVYGVFIMRSIMRPINLCSMTMQDITHTNNLKQRIEYQLQDEMGAMIVALNAMLSKMQTSLHDIQDDMGRTSMAASSLKTSSEKVAQSASAQSDSSSAMAASIEEMTVSINTVSGSADQTRQLADESEKISVEGGDIIAQTAAEMANIAHSVGEASRVIGSLGEASQQISVVVQVIKEVADQTNLLALNAAIEAARAGEQGRGFAVVADEVRKLAERTTSSTSEIGQMIGKIQNAANESVREMQHVVGQVQTGQALAQDAGERINGIRDAVKRVTAAVSEISEALKEQSSASNDIARHVEQMAQMADENLSFAETSSKSAQEVDTLSQSVSRTINSFQV